MREKEDRDERREEEGDDDFKMMLNGVLRCGFGLLKKMIVKMLLRKRREKIKNKKDERREEEGEDDFDDNDGCGY